MEQTWHTRLTNPHLTAELEDVMTHHIQVNMVHCRCITQIYALPAFNSVKTLGQRIRKAGNSAETSSGMDTNIGDEADVHNDVESNADE